jgi:DNA polymerase-3 subunit epsilon
MSYKMKRIIMDVETTGLNTYSNGIYQYAAIIEIDGEVEETITSKFRTLENETFHDVAFENSPHSIEDVRAFPKSSNEAFKEFKETLSRYISRYDKKDKFFFYAYNEPFDTSFLRNWFKKNGEVYFGSYFWSPGICVMRMYAEKVAQGKLPKGENFKLATAAQMLLDIDDRAENYHDALFDVKQTYQILKKIEEA